ncbi:MAG: KOW domain-containing RNA-binding protein [Christensenellaceae bacterium]
MRDFSAEVGRICISKMGRDKGKAFVIVSVMDDTYVMLADGMIRKLISPKKKKLKHVELKPLVLDTIKEKLENDKKVFDAEIRSALINTMQENQKEE